MGLELCTKHPKLDALTESMVSNLFVNRAVG